uniref:Uncharacterized protein n=1 Tax=uncultured Thiotrichaceae bacterium TaxID=298394 RepID=A0A6S6TGY5_9GAMM|nr:MAG: Unknown protein [uncultured Thiotrichaceae bacterium]
MQTSTELSKIRDLHNKNLINEFITESICFEEFVELMGDNVPAWFSLGKCWEEETGESIQEVA